MKIHQIVNSHRLSNSYIIELKEDLVILIDVGNFDIDCFLFWLKRHKKKLHSVIITHEHSDHCCGLNQLYEVATFDLYCSSKCAENMKNSKQNFSIYLDNIPAFEVKMPYFSVDGLSEINIEGTLFSIIETPGHSPGSICIAFQNTIFTGDTILNGIKTLLTLPHSNKKDHSNSIETIKSFLKKDMIIYPGHDEPFLYTEEKDIIGITNEMK